MHYFPGGSLRLRCDEETEIIGVDEGEMGEFAYDYVGLEAELGPRHEMHNDIHGAAGGREPVIKPASEHTTQDEKDSAGVERTLQV
jgi:Amt family ammonium transporter